MILNTRVEWKVHLSKSEYKTKLIDSPAVGGVAQFSLFNPEKSRVGFVHPLVSQVRAILKGKVRLL